MMGQLTSILASRQVFIWGSVALHLAEPYNSLAEQAMQFQSIPPGYTATAIACGYQSALVAATSAHEDAAAERVRNVASKTAAPAPPLKTAAATLNTDTAASGESHPVRAEASGMTGTLFVSQIAHEASGASAVDTTSTLPEEAAASTPAGADGPAEVSTDDGAVQLSMPDQASSGSMPEESATGADGPAEASTDVQLSMPDQAPSSSMPEESGTGKAAAQSESDTATRVLPPVHAAFPEPLGMCGDGVLQPPWVLSCDALPAAVHPLDTAFYGRYVEPSPDAVRPRFVP